MIKYKWIDGSDPMFNVVLEKINELGWTDLNRATSRVLCAIEDTTDFLIGFHVLQLFPHAEPLYVEPAFRGSGIAEDLAAGMVRFLLEMNARGFMVIADTPQAAKLCETYGMKRVESPVYLA